MKQILFFELGGKFAHFKFPFTSPNFLKKSFSIPPKTTVLGILGSIIGLNGFQNYELNEPEYYSKLKHIPITIHLDKIPMKSVIQYNSLNSFAKDIADNPNVIIKEEILLEPNYKIGLILDDSNENDRLLIELFNKKKISSKYHIYLGKNEFFANISNIKLFRENEFEIVNVSEVEHLNSIIPISFLNLNILYEHLIYESFSKDINFSDKKLKTVLCEIGFFIEEEKENVITFNTELKLYKIGNNHYYFFENES